MWLTSYQLICPDTVWEGGAVSTWEQHTIHNTMCATKQHNARNIVRNYCNAFAERKIRVGWGGVHLSVTPPCWPQTQSLRRPRNAATMQYLCDSAL